MWFSLHFSANKSDSLRFAFHRSVWTGDKQNSIVSRCGDEITSHSAAAALWFIPPIFSWMWRHDGGGAGESRWVWQNINSAAGHCSSSRWCFKPTESFFATSMRRRSSSNASGRSSTLRRRSDNLRFDEFGFAVLTKRKDLKLHHRCHEYRCELIGGRLRELLEASLTTS